MKLKQALNEAGEIRTDKYRAYVMTDGMGGSLSIEPNIERITIPSEGSSFADARKFIDQFGAENAEKMMDAYYKNIVDFNDKQLEEVKVQVGKVLDAASILLEGIVANAAEDYGSFIKNDLFKALEKLQ